MRGFVSLIGVLATFLLWSGSASAATGDVLRTVTPAACQGGATGITLKGKDLLVTCPWGGAGALIDELKAKNGKVVRAYPISGVDGSAIYAMAYSPQVLGVYVCVTVDFANFTLGVIDLVTENYYPVGATADCTGGLEYDQAHRLWSAAFDGSSVLQIDPTTGATERSFPVGPALGTCGVSGVAVESGRVLFSSTGFTDTVVDCGLFSLAPKTGQTGLVVPAGTMGTLFDLACDNKNFALTHTAAVWEASADTGKLVAFEAPGSGGAATPKCR